MGNAGNNVWSSIKRLLIVVKFEEIDTMNQWREAIKLSGLNIHDCKIMGIIGTRKERIAMREMSSVVYISDKDFGLLGKLKNEDAQRVLSDRFDTILVLGTIPNKIEKALQKASAELDIGLNSEDGDRTINLLTDESAPKYMLNFVKQTLEKIS
jgi:hypothetical protein